MIHQRLVEGTEKYRGWMRKERKVLNKSLGVFGLEIVTINMNLLETISLRTGRACVCVVRCGDKSGNTLGPALFSVLIKQLVRFLVF